MYTVKELARLTGLTPRTLRYYDAVGLLCPCRGRENDYRFYGPQEVERLQQILLYRDMGLPLEEIKRLLDAPGFDREAALREHLDRLRAEHRQALALQRQRLEEAVQARLEPLADRSEELTRRLEEARAEAQRKLRVLYEGQDFFDRRLLRSFPALKSTRHSEALAKLREYLANRKQSIKENKEM